MDASEPPEMLPFRPLRLLGAVLVLAIPPLIIDYAVEEWLLADAGWSMWHFLMLRTCIFGGWVMTVALATFGVRELIARAESKAERTDRDKS